MTTRKEWFEALKKYLCSLPENEQKKALDYYNEIFEDKYESGMSERDIIASFASPADAAKSIIDEYNREQPFRYKSNYCGDNDVYIGKEESYSSITSDVDYGDLKIYPTPDSKLTVTFSSDSHYEIRDGKGNLHIEKHEGIKTFINKRAEVRVFVPSSCLCGYTLKTKAGKIELNGISGEDVKANAGAGTVTLDNSNFAEADIYSSAGKILVNDSSFRELKVRTDAGSCDVINTRTEIIHSMVSTGRVKIDGVTSTELVTKNTAGATELKCVRAKYIDISSDVGAVTGEICGDKSEYTIKASMGLGSCNLSDCAGSTEKTLTVKSSLGRINLKFI